MRNEIFAALFGVVNTTCIAISLLVTSNTNTATALNSVYLFLSLCLSTSSCCSLRCRRLCRALDVTLGDGGQGVNWWSSELWSPEGFTPKRCCSTTELIVLFRILTNKNVKRRVWFVKKELSFKNWWHNYASHRMRAAVIKCTYVATSGLQWTGERWLLREKQERKKVN